MSADPRFDAERNLIVLGERRIVFHCHHYNLFLQRTIHDGLGDKAVVVQQSAAAESARRLLEPVFGADGGASCRTRLDRATELFGSLGFGLAETQALDENGGRVRLVTSHYAVGWRAKWGPAEGPVCHFAVGYWAGALAAATGIAPERILSREARCEALEEQGGCEIEIEVL